MSTCVNCKTLSAFPRQKLCEPCAFEAIIRLENDVMTERNRRNVIEIECPCGTVFKYNHGDTETGRDLANVFINIHEGH
jgi:hypothetical protein